MSRIIIEYRSPKMDFAYDPKPWGKQSKIDDFN
jgi:hypothetical protein